MPRGLVLIYENLHLCGTISLPAELPLSYSLLLSGTRQSGAPKAGGRLRRASARAWLRPRPQSHYWRLPGARQPHGQFVAWQRHAFSGHPQEQVEQSQVAFPAVSSGVFFWVVIVFSFFQRFMRFQRS